MSDHSDLGFQPAQDNAHDDLGFQPEAKEDPGILESGVRGAAQGATLGFEPAIAGAGDAAYNALKDAVMKGQINVDDIKNHYNATRESERQANDLAQKVNPTSSLIGNLVGGAGLAAATAGAGLLPEAAEGANLGARMLNAAKVGALAGGTNELGNSVSAAQGLGDTVKNVAGGVAMGAITGPIVEAGITGLKSAANGIGNEIADTNSYQKFKKAFDHGLNGTNLTSKSGLASAQQGVEDASEALGMGARDANKAAGAEVGAAKEALQQSDKKFDISDQVNKIKNVISKLQNSSDPDAEKDAAFLQKYLDNIVLGKEQEVPFSKLNFSEDSPSSVQKLEAKAAAERAKGLTLGHDVSTDIGKVTDEKSGTPFDTLLKSVGDKKSATVLPSTEAEEASTIPGSLSNKTVRLGGIDPTSVDFNTASDINNTLTRLGGATDAPTPLNTNEALNNSKLIARDLKTTLTNPVPEGAEGPMTRLEAANQKASASYKALNALGVDDSHFETNPLTGEKVLTPQGEAKLANTIRQIGRGSETQAGQNATSRLNTALDYLRSVDPEKAQAIQSQVQNAGEIHSLAQQGQGNLFSKSGLLDMGPVQTGNRLGRLASTPVNTLQGVVNGAKNMASDAGKKVSTAIQPLTDTAFGEAAKNLAAKGTGIGMKLGSELAKGIGKDNSQKNAILFSLMQQPAYREELQKHFSTESGTQE